MLNNEWMTKQTQKKIKNKNRMKISLKNHEFFFRCVEHKTFAFVSACIANHHEQIEFVIDIFVYSRHGDT